MKTFPSTPRVPLGDTRPQTEEADAGSPLFRWPRRQGQHQPSLHRAVLHGRLAAERSPPQIVHREAREGGTARQALVVRLALLVPVADPAAAARDQVVDDLPRLCADTGLERGYRLVGPAGPRRVEGGPLGRTHTERVRERLRINALDISSGSLLTFCARAYAKLRLRRAASSCIINRRAGGEEKNREIVSYWYRSYSCSKFVLCIK